MDREAEDLDAALRIRGSGERVTEPGPRLKMPLPPFTRWKACFICGGEHKCSHREMNVEWAVIAGQALRKSNAAIARTGMGV